MTTILDDLQEFQKLMEFQGDKLFQPRLDNYATGMFELATRSKLYIQMMASAYLEETNIPATECELVIKQDPFTTETSISFRRRAP
jgi:hypothetical protein